jgi:hypothetical protein
VKQFLVIFRRGHPQHIEAEGFHQHVQWYEFFGCSQAPVRKTFDRAAVAEVLEVKNTPARDSWNEVR